MPTLQEVLERNLQALESTTNHVISAFDPEKTKHHLIRDHDDKVIIQRDGEYLRYDNSDVFESFRHMNFQTSGMYLILGLLDIGMIQEIYNEATRDSVIVVIEPNPEVFYYMVTNYNLAPLFEKENFYLIVADFEEAPSYFSYYLLRKGWISKASHLQYYISKYLEKYEKKKSYKLIKQFVDYIRTNLFMLGNATDDTMLGLLQNLLNLKVFSRTMSIKKLKNAYQSTPAVIVSAGPSLEKNVYHLLSYPRENLLIFSVDTVLKKLLDMGITPDAVFAIERVREVYEYFFEKVEVPKDLVLVAPPVVYPKILGKFSLNRMLMPLKEDEKINEWLNELVSNRADLISSGTSVAHIAFSFARYLGCDPIILIGQDLSYGDEGATHTKGTIYDEKKIKRIEEELVVEGYYGNQVKTTRIWKNFANWFEEEFYKTVQKVINATEGGMKLNHCEQMPLQEALEKYAVKKCKPLYRLIDEQYEPMLTDNEEIARKIRYEAEAITRYKELLDSFLDKINKMENIIKYSYKNKNYLSFFHQLKEIDEQYRKELVKLRFFILFVQTHCLIATFERNKLGKHLDRDNLIRLIEIEKKLYSVSRDLAEMVAAELDKFLRTSFAVGS